MTQQERQRFVEQHIHNYNMSREEAEAVVDSMTETEIRIARQHGFGRKEEKLQDILCRGRQHAVPAPAPPPAAAIDIRAYFIDCVRRLCAARQREFRPEPEFMQNVGKVMDWVNDGRQNAKWLVLFGSVGNGKSTVARAALMTLRQQGIDCTEKNSYDIGLLYREVNRQQKAADEYDRLARCQMLFIDDLGTESNPMALNEILYERYNNMRNTIFTTNLGYTELKDRYGARIFDRFEELSELVRFAAASFRARSRQTTLAL